VEILYAPKFKRQFKKLTRDVQLLVAGREHIFKLDPFDSRLKTHKLTGRLEGYYSFSINFSYRIIFDFKDDKNVRFYEVGDHDIYD